MDSYVHFVLFVIFIFYFSCVCNASTGFGSLSRNYMNGVKSDSSSGCECQTYVCGCCAHLEVEKIGLNETGCVNVTYLKKQYGMSFTVSLDNKILFNETISVVNPPPYCVGIPYVKQYAEICVRFYDLSLHHHVHGCIKLEARLSHIIIKDYNLGCFTIGGNSMQKVIQI